MKEKHLTILFLSSLLFLFVALNITGPQPKYEEPVTMAAEEPETEEVTEADVIKVPRGAFVASYVREIVIEEPTTTTAEEEYWEAQKTYAKVGITEDYQLAFIDLCEQYDFSYELLLAWAYTESRWQMDAVSPSGAVGLMQIMPCYWEEPAQQLGLNIYEPVGNVAFALYLINEYLQKSNGDMTQALNAYNGNGWYAQLVYDNYEMLLSEHYFY